MHSATFARVALSLSLLPGLATAAAAQQAKPVVRSQPGKFGQALNFRNTPVRTKSLPPYRRFPLTVEMWVKLPSEKKYRYNLLASNLPGSPSGHWELYTTPLDGLLNVKFTNFKPDNCQSHVRITDDQWHYIALTCDGKHVTLYLDGKQVGREALTPVEAKPPTEGELFVGSELERAEATRFAGLIDELRISNVVREINSPPSEPFEADRATVGLWHFDEREGTRRSDTSLNGNNLTYSPGINSAWTPLSSTRPDAEPWERETDEDWKDARFDAMNKGHYLGLAMTVPAAYPGGKNAYAAKGLAMLVGDEQQAAVLFERGMLQLSAAWMGDFGKNSHFLHIPERRFGLIQHPTPNGKPLFTTARAPGWQQTTLDQKGSEWRPLPERAGRYEGLYVYGPCHVLRYRVANTQVFDLPWATGTGPMLAVTRTLEIAPGDEPLTLNLLADPRIESREVAGKSLLVLPLKGELLAIAASGACRLEAANGRAALAIPPRSKTEQARLAYWRGNAERLPEFVKQFQAAPVLPAAMAGLSQLSGVAETKQPPDFPQRWTERITTRGQLGQTDGPFAVDTLTLPFENPYRSIFYVTGVGFLQDGAVAICTIYGDVWLARFDDELHEIRWKRFASGMYQPLGLTVKDDDIYVLERGQITRLVDQDHDGEADLYQNFYNGWQTTGAGHAYDTAIKLAPDGSFYLFKGQVGSEHCDESGCLLHVAADGSSHEVYATGFRHPIGLGIGPDGTVTGGDQQGNWMPATRVDRYHQGGFYGDMRTHHRAKPPEAFDPPICWLPHAVDNSAGGQVWVPKENWGPLGGKPLHFSWGRCRLFLLLTEEVGSLWQGGVVPLDCDTFQSGTITGAFRPADGHLYVAGLHGWQTAGEKDGCLQRVRYTGKKLRMPLAVKTHADGVTLTFSDPLDAPAASDVSNYTVEEWNYKYSAAYGSDHWSVARPDRQGHDRLTVQSAQLTAGGRQLRLRFPLSPVMQLKIAYRLKSADGKPVENAIHYTVHKP